MSGSMSVPFLSLSLCFSFSFSSLSLSLCAYPAVSPVFVFACKYLSPFFPILSLSLCLSHCHSPPPSNTPQKDIICIYGRTIRGLVSRTWITQLHNVVEDNTMSSDTHAQADEEAVNCVKHPPPPPPTCSRALGFVLIVIFWVENCRQWWERKSETHRLNGKFLWHTMCLW